MISELRKRFVNRQGIMSLLVGAIGLGMLGILLGIFTLVVVKVNTTMASSLTNETSLAAAKGGVYTMMTTTITALAEYTNWMQLIALVASAAALLMILMGVFIRIRGGMAGMGGEGGGGTI